MPLENNSILVMYRYAIGKELNTCETV